MFQINECSHASERERKRETTQRGISKHVEKYRFKWKITYFLSVNYDYAYVSMQQVLTTNATKTRVQTYRYVTMYMLHFECFYLH